MQKYFSIVILFFFIGFINTYSQVQNKKTFYEPVLSSINWILENTFIIGIKIILIPIKPVFKYVYKKKVINRFIKFSYIDDAKKNTSRKQILPIFNLNNGRGSFIGLKYKYTNFIFSNSNFYMKIYININLNNNVKISYDIKDWIFSNTIFVTSLEQNISTQSSLIAPTSRKEVFFSNYSSKWNNRFDIITKRNLTPNIGFGITHYLYYTPEFKTLKITCDKYFFSGSNCLKKRGIGFSSYDFNYKIGIIYNTINNPYIPHTGILFDIFIEDHWTVNKNNFRKFGILLRHYLYLGDGIYRNIDKEIESFKNFKIKNITKYTDINYLTEQLLNKQTVIVQIKLRGSEEQKGHDLPIDALHSLGYNTPLRGYSGIIDNNKYLLSLSTEYRFPVAYFVELLIFSDFGQVSEKFKEISILKLKKSVGFGFRMSRDDLFLFKLLFGFRKFGKPNIILNLKQTY